MVLEDLEGSPKLEVVSDRAVFALNPSWEVGLCIIPGKIQVKDSCQF